VRIIKELHDLLRSGYYDDIVPEHRDMLHSSAVASGILGAMGLKGDIELGQLPRPNQSPKPQNQNQNQNQNRLTSKEQKVTSESLLKSQ